MKTNAFAYHRPETAQEAVRLAIECGDGARFIAGGQSLLAALNFRLDEPDALIDISRIASLRGIEAREDRIVIGALTRHVEIANSPDIARDLPLIARAIQEVAHPAIRNRGTFGGSLALADPAAEMPACTLVLDAVMHVLGVDGPRKVPAAEFFCGMYETSLAEGELLTHVEIPVPEPGARYGFGELARRHGDYAMAGLAMMLGPSNGQTPSWARVAFFGVSDCPVRCPDAEAAIMAGETAQACAAKACVSLDLFGDLNAGEDTKRHYAQVLLRRALTRITEQEDQSE